MFHRLFPTLGPSRQLVFAQLVSSIGDGAYYVTAALFFTRIVGLSATQVGLGLTIAGALGLAAGVPLGHLADRLGPRRVATALTVGAGFACTAYLFVDSFVPFVLAACGFSICVRGAVAARQALLAGLVTAEQRTRVRAHMQANYNAGLSLGACLGGLALFFDTREAYLATFAVDAITFLVAGALLSHIVEVAPAHAGRPSGGPRLAVFRDRPYAVITFLNFILVLHIPLIDVALPLWTVTHTAAPRWIVASLFVVNTLAVVLFQVRVARGVTDQRSAYRFVLRGSALLLLSCAAFALSSVGASPYFAGLALLTAALLQVFGEMLQLSGTWELSFALAPQHQHGQYQGFFNSGLSAAEMIGPLFLTALVVSWGWPGWLLLGSLFFAAGFAMGPAVRWAQRPARFERKESDEHPESILVA